MVNQKQKYERVAEFVVDYIGRNVNFIGEEASRIAIRYYSGEEMQYIAKDEGTDVNTIRLQVEKAKKEIVEVICSRDRVTSIEGKLENYMARCKKLEDENRMLRELVEIKEKFPEEEPVRTMTSIAVLPISDLQKRALRRADIYTVEMLSTMTAHDLKRRGRFGPAAMEEIRKGLFELKKILRDDPSAIPTTKI